MTTLLVGFDSAWTANHRGALVGVLHVKDGTFKELGSPRIANYREGEDAILKWQAESRPTATIVLLDQPTIVTNPAGQRPVENIVASAISRRRGGMQPANTSKEDMFGPRAPIWPFLNRFGGPVDPLQPVARAFVLETYPVLATIVLGWTLPDSRVAGRLPKYNPQGGTFRNRIGSTCANWPPGDCASADSSSSLSGWTILPGKTRLARVIKTSWMLRCVCSWRCTWP